MLKENIFKDQAQKEMNKYLLEQGYSMGVRRRSWWAASRERPATKKVATLSNIK